MLVDWTRHLTTPKEKEDFESSLHGSKRILDRLKALIEERELSIDVSERGLKQFESPNWAAKQAFQNGYKASSEIIKKLINLDQQISKETK